MRPPSYTKSGGASAIDEAERELRALREEQFSLLSEIKGLSQRAHKVDTELSNQESTRRLLESHLSLRQMKQEIVALIQRERQEAATLDGQFRC